MYAIMCLFSFHTLLMRLQKLSKKQIKESLEQVPAHVILTGNRKLSHKQKAYCKNIVEGMTQTEAYAQAYKHKGKRKTMSDNASRLSKDSRIQAEIEALERAKQFNAMYSLAQLRTLVISQLTKEAIDPESKPSERIAALGKLGQVAELGVFVQRTETKVIKDSESAKNELMEQLKKALGDQIRTIDSGEDEEANRLLEIVTSPHHENGESETPPIPDPHSDQNHGSHELHSTPDNRSENSTKHASSTKKHGQLETLPVGTGEGVEILDPNWESNDTEDTPLGNSNS